MAEDFFDKLTLMRAAAYAPVKADIDSLIGQIDGVKQNLASAQTEEQLNTALENQKYYTDRASRYKSTKMYADIVANMGENSKTSYNEYEDAIVQSTDYMNKNSFLDTKKEWSAQGLNKMIQEDLLNDDGTPQYESLVDYFIEEQRRVGNWMSGLAETDKEGNPMRKQFRYNKNGVNDRDTLMRLQKYSDQLDMGIQMLYADGVITPEEAYLLFTAQPGVYDAKKTEAKANAKAAIDSNLGQQDKYLTLLKQLSASGNAAGVYALLEQDTTMLQETGALPSDDAQSIKDKLTQAMISSQQRLGMAQNHWLAWEGTPYMGGLADASGLDDEMFPQDKLDEQQLTQARFNELSDEEQVAYIEGQKKLGMEAYEEEKDNEINQYLSEQGFFEKHPEAALGVGIPAAYAVSEHEKIYKYAADKTKDATNFLNSNTKLSNKDVVKILNTDYVQKNVDKLNLKFKEIADLEDVIKKSKKYDPDLNKNKLKLKTLKNEALKFKNIIHKDIKSYLNIKITKTDLNKLLDNPEKWNLSKTRAKLSQVPGGVKNWFNKNNIGKFTKGVGKGFVWLKGAEGVGETIGLDHITELIGKDVLGMDVFEQDRLLNDIVTVSGGAKATEQAVKRFWPKMIQLAKSKKGKQLLGKILSQSTIKRMTSAKVAKGLRAKVILGIIGLVMTGKDVYRFVMGDVENMTEEEIDAFANEILSESENRESFLKETKSPSYIEWS